MLNCQQENKACEYSHLVFFFSLSLCSLNSSAKPRVRIPHKKKRVNVEKAIDEYCKMQRCRDRQ